MPATLLLPHLPAGTTFLFRTDDIEPNFQVQGPLISSTYCWTPPTHHNAYHSTNGPIYRWRDGVITLATLANTPHLASLTSHETCLYLFRSSTIFTQVPDTPRFLAVLFDARTHNLPVQGRSWQPVMFDHVPHPANPTFLYSDVGVTRPYTQLAAPAATNSSWVQELFDPHYRWSEIYHGSSEPQPKSAGLIGNLSIILGLVAFSRPPGQLPAVLINNVRRGRWIPHHLDHGRVQHRGVVTTVWRDVQTPHAVLRRLENGEYGAFFAP
jgi:hypothetical protein